jgi:hypothetical protein
MNLNRLCDLRVRFRYPGILLLLAVALVTLHDSTSQAASPFQYEEPKLLTATIYSLDRKTVLFKFSRRSTRTAGELEVTREYTYPDGKLAARERVLYKGNDLQSYELEELQTGGFGRATIKPDPSNPQNHLLAFEFSKEPARTKPKRDSEILRPDTLNNDTIGPFLASHWAALAKGEEVKCRFIVIPRMETVGFRFVKESEAQWHGQPVIILRMEPTSPLIRALVDPLHFKVEKDGQHRVLEYSGRTTPKIKSGNRWQELDAITVFDWATGAAR